MVHEYRTDGGVIIHASYFFSEGGKTVLLQATAPEKEYSRRRPDILGLMNGLMRTETARQMQAEAASGKTPATLSFQRPQSASAYISPPPRGYGIHYDKRKWRPTIDDRIDMVFYSTVSREASVSVMVIADHVPYSDVRERLLSTSENDFQEPELLEQDERLVNGIRVHYLKMLVKDRSRRFIRVCYFYADLRERLLLSSWTYENRFDIYESAILELMNGVTAD